MPNSDNGREHNDNLAHKDFTDRLKYVGKFAGKKIDQGLDELFYGNYPNLSHKELTICRIIANTIWDLQTDALYLEVQARAEDRLVKLFENTKEIEAVIKSLIDKEIVRLQTTYTSYGDGERWDLRRERVLRLRDDIQSEACEIIWEEFHRMMKEAFAPIHL